MLGIRQIPDDDKRTYQDLADLDRNRALSQSEITDRMTAHLRFDRAGGLSAARNPEAVPVLGGQVMPLENAS